MQICFSRFNLLHTLNQQGNRSEDTSSSAGLVTQICGHRLLPLLCSAIPARQHLEAQGSWSSMLRIPCSHGIVQRRKEEMDGEGLSSGVSPCWSWGRPFPELPRTLLSHLIRWNLQRCLCRGEESSKGSWKCEHFQLLQKKVSKE